MSDPLRLNRQSFLIAPVRGHSPGEWANAVFALEGEGWSVYWPARDTDQTDLVGLDICRTNVQAISGADAVHVIWDGHSQGCLFDLGAAFALGKRVIPLILPPASEGKSFQNMISAWARL